MGYYTAEARIAEKTPSDDGATVALVLTVNAGPKVEIRWDRTADPPPGNLDTLVPVRQEGSIDIDLLDQGKQNLEDTLKREGYWKAEVSHTRMVEGDLLVITYRIVRGRKFLIDRHGARGRVEHRRARRSRSCSTSVAATSSTIRR